MTIKTNSLDQFDRGGGNGAQSEKQNWLDEQSIYSNEWGSNAATTFNPNESDANGHTLSHKKQQKFESLYKLHNGKMEQSRKGDIRSSHVKNDAKMFMSVIEMPDNQRKRVLHILGDLDISSNNFGPRPYEKIVLALCTLVSDESLGEKANASIDDRLIFDESFRELMDCTGTSSKNIRRLREDIRERSEHF